MKPELFMRREKDAIDVFAAFMNVNSMQATESNFGTLRKEVDRAEKRIMKEVRMKRMKGVSVGRHPYFQKRGSFDGEKMVVALRIDFKGEGSQHYNDIAKFIERLGFREKAMALAASQACRNIILTGPPGSGKTTMMKRFKGIARIVDEVAREVIKERDARNKWGTGSLQPEIYKRAKARVEAALGSEDDFVLFDRTHIDCLAYGYTPEEPPQTIRNAEVWVLKHHAEWFENDPERRETAAEAEALGERLKKVYRDLGYSVREIDAADPETWPVWVRKRLERRKSAMDKSDAVAVKRHLQKKYPEWDFRVRRTPKGKVMVKVAKPEGASGRDFEEGWFMPKYEGDEAKTLEEFLTYLDRQFEFYLKKVWKVARGTNNRGRIEEFDFNRPTTHLSVVDVINGVVENMEELVNNRKLMAARKDLEGIYKATESIYWKSAAAFMKKNDKIEVVQALARKIRYRMPPFPTINDSGIEPDRFEGWVKSGALVKIASVTAKKKPLNRDRRVKQMLKTEPKKERGEMPPPSKRHKDKRKEDRQRSKSNLKKEYVGMEADVVRELVKVTKLLVADSKEDFERDKSSLLKELTESIERSAKGRIGQITRYARHYVQEGTVINRKLRIRDFVTTGSFFPGSVYSYASRGELSNAAKKAAPIQFTLPVRVGDKMFEGKYKGETEVSRFDRRGGLEYTIRAKLTNADEIAREAPDQQLIDKLYMKFVKELRGGFDEAVQDSVGGKSIGEADVDYDTERGEPGTAWTPPVPARIIFNKLVPSEFDYAVPWNDILSSLSLNDEVKSLRDQGEKVDLENLGKMALKGFGNGHLVEVSVDVDIVGEINPPAEYQIKKVTSNAVIVTIEPWPDEDKLAEDIDDRLREW